MAIKKLISDVSLKDPNYIETLAKILTTHDLSALEIKSDKMSLSLKRGTDYASFPIPSPTLAATPAAMPAGDNAAAVPAEKIPAGTAIHSPMVGTAYLAPQPGANPFVAVGDTVKEGDTLMIIEAMKVMNPIAAPCNGTVLAISVESGHPVEFDEILMTLDSA